MPPIPKDESELRGRNKVAPSQMLPLDGYAGPYPSPPDDLADELVDVYVELWESPTAAAWLSTDAALVVELVELRAIASTSRRRGEAPTGPVMSRIGIVEDRLGLSPRARAAHRWRVVDVDPVSHTPRPDLGRWEPTNFEEAPS